MQLIQPRKHSEDTLNDTATPPMHFSTATDTHPNTRVVDENNFGPSHIEAFGSHASSELPDDAMLLAHNGFTKVLQVVISHNHEINQRRVHRHNHRTFQSRKGTPREPTRDKTTNCRASKNQATPTARNAPVRTQILASRIQRPRAG